VLIGLSGKARSGKDTFGEYLIEAFKDKYDRNFIKMSFADELKLMCKDQFNLYDSQLWGNKKESIDYRLIKNFAEFPSPHIEAWTAREIMQKVGAFYRSIINDFWVNKLNEKIKKVSLKGYKDFIITDVRYLNEAEFIKRGKGILIRIDKKEEKDDGIHWKNHESEISLDSYKDFDINISNYGTLKDLKKISYETIFSIVAIEKLIEKGELTDGK
jgi:hypothetical protein